MKSRLISFEKTLYLRTIEYFGLPIRGHRHGYYIYYFWMAVIKPPHSQPYIYAHLTKEK
ncbi:hypothetical protein MTO96_036230, partial [Rhipicephalus appendiculatus]